MNELIEFLVNQSSHVSYQDRWMCCREEQDEFQHSILYTVYQRRYGQRKTRTLYEGFYLSTALQFLQGDTE